MKSFINKTFLAIILTATIFSCSKENVLKDYNGQSLSLTSNSSKNDTPYVSGVKLDTPYIESALMKNLDTPYLGNKVIDTPYLKK